MRMTSKITLAAIGAAMLGASVANADPIIYDTAQTLSTLTAGAGNGDAIIVGDKMFFNFAYAATGDMPTDSAINVIPITDLEGNFGIRFQGAFQDKVGGGASDALITYDVLVLDQNFAISDAHIAGNTFVFGTGHITVTETWLPDNAEASIAIWDIRPGSMQLKDSVIFLPTTYTLLHVQKDILADAGAAYLNDAPNASLATMSFVDQTYSQVPEPASLGVLAIGAAGLMFRRRKA
jgi:hypothetical protein